MEGKGRYIIMGAAAIAVAILTFFGGRSVGVREGIMISQVDAIKGGHAKYVISDELGHTEFHWLEKGDVEIKKVVPAAEEKKP